MRASRAAMLALTTLLLLFYAPLFAGKVLVDRDLFRLFIPDAHFLRASLASLEWPLWNPYQRLGQPFAATMYSQVYYPPHVLLVLCFAPARALTVQVVLHVALLAAGAYWVCRSRALSRTAAFIAAAAAAFTPLLTQMTSQVNILSALAWSGFQLVALLRLGETRSLRWASLATLFFTASVLCGSPEVFLMQLLLGALLVALRERERRALGISAIVPLAACVASLVVLLPAAELALSSTRAGPIAGAHDWSASFGDLGSLAVITNSGAPRRDFLPTTTMGAVICALALVAIVELRRLRAAWPFAVGALVLATVSLGEHFAPAALVLKVPPLSFFRYPSRYLVGAAFCIAILAGFGAQSLLEITRRRLAAALGVLVVCELAVIVAVGGQTQIVWAAVFTALAASALWFRSVTALAALCVVELLAARIYLQAPGWRDIALIERPSALDQVVDHSEGARISVELESYTPDDLIEKSRDALIPLRFVEEGLEAVEGYGAPEPKLITQLTEEFQMPRVLYDLATTRSFVRDGPPPFEGMKLAPRRAGLPRVWLSETALPRAFVVTSARVASDSEAASLLTDPGWDAKTTALLAPGAEAVDNAQCESTVTRAVVSTREQRYSLFACADGYLHIGDAWFPGWEATVDGIAVPIARANLLFRAVRVNAGKREVVLTYSPWTSRLGASVSLLMLASLIAGVAGGGRRA